MPWVKISPICLNDWLSDGRMFFFFFSMQKQNTTNNFTRIERQCSKRTKGMNIGKVDEKRVSIFGCQASTIDHRKSEKNPFNANIDHCLAAHLLKMWKKNKIENCVNFQRIETSYQIILPAIDWCYDNVENVRMVFKATLKSIGRSSEICAQRVQYHK